MIRNFIFTKFSFGGWGTLILLTFLTCSQNGQKQENIIILENALNQLEKNPSLENGTLSFDLIRLKDYKTLAQKNAQKTIPFASCIKLISTATALEILGSDFRFYTTLEYDGNIINGTLNGNLYIKGTGDPTLGSNIMADQHIDRIFPIWVQRIQQAGITKITGKIIADESLFPMDITPHEWIWGDIGNFYGATAGALNIFDNQYTLFLQPNNILYEKPQIIRTQPTGLDIEFVNELKTENAGSGDQSTINGGVFEQKRYLNGTIPQGGTFQVKGSLPNPALTCAKYLQGYLKNNNILVEKNPTTSRLIIQQKQVFNKNNRKLIYTHQSPTLKTICEFTNFYSINLFAEAIHKQIGFTKKKYAGTRAGVNVTKEYWEKRGLNTKGFFQQDGSGLASTNAMTASQMTSLLAKMSKSKNFPYFFGSMPISAKDGTMQHIGKNTKMANNLRAKTGAITRVQSFAGYFRNNKKELYAFSLCVHQYTNNYTEMQKKLENLMKIMVESCD
jgi:serine-type D-Ala-D-Ala carboxypeptidase/endopeptidase (penicillin-binding protein 4)